MPTCNGREHSARRLDLRHHPQLVRQTPTPTALNAPDDLQRAISAHSDALSDVRTSIFMGGSLRHRQAALAGRIRYGPRRVDTALLAPDVVEAILDGRQPEGMTLPGLMEGVEVEWGLF